MEKDLMCHQEIINRVIEILTSLGIDGIPKDNGVIEIGPLIADLDECVGKQLISIHVERLIAITEENAKHVKEWRMRDPSLK